MAINIGEFKKICIVLNNGVTNEYYNKFIKVKGEYKMSENNNGYGNNDYQNNNGNYYNANNNNQGSYYYSSDFSNGYGGYQPPPPKKKFPKTALAIIGFILVTLAVIIIMALLTTFLSSPEESSSNGSVNMAEEEITIVKNAPKIEITQNTDVEYVPQSIPEVVKKVGSSVVEISTSSVVTDGFFRQYVTSGAGSGVIITQSAEAGYLLTNHHVVGGTSEITVRLTNGDEYPAQILGSDAELDLALLRISKKADETFTVAPLGDSSKLAVGQDVIAIGNPLGSLGGTVTDGIISALDRTVTIDNVAMVLMQHNAAINPGNSGGGLFDAMGNLIGIVNAKTSQTGIEGLGFAIPVNIAYDFFNRIMVIEPTLVIKVAYGHVDGIFGVYVIEIPAENSAFNKYDRIIAINGQQITTESEYYKAIGAIRAGDTATFTVQRNSSAVNVKISFEQ